MLASDTSFALFDDNLSGSDDLVLHDLRRTLRCTRISQLEATFAAIDQARREGYWVALAASYELGLALEPALQQQFPSGEHDLLTVWIFAHAETWSSERTDRELASVCSRLDEHSNTAGILDFTFQIDPHTYRNSVEYIRALIRAGDCYQVNYTFPSTGQLSGHPLALYAALRRSQPVHYGGFVQHQGGTVLSRSPELFVQRHGTQLTCKPMKGTAARSEHGRILASSEKNRAENLMIVDLIRNDLGRLAPPGGVRVQSLFDLEPYPSVWQMTSTITAAPVQAELPDIFHALFPCGSITGAPKIRAMQIIRELEPAPRGLYCGALGWLAPDGDFRFNVPIRTLQVAPDGRFRCGLGSGIVADSNPEAEWDECRLKSHFLTEVAPGFGLVETLRCEAGTTDPYPLLSRHLSRLRSSAGRLGFVLDEAAVREALLQRATQLKRPHRVRLQLEHDGRFEITHALLHPLEAAKPTVTLATTPVRSADPLLQHKVSCRGLYDRTLQGATQAGHFDALFFNERDELTEGARSSILVDVGQAQWLTPPLHSGVLDGVYRRLLLDQGQAREATVERQTLLNARALYVCNALRGVLQVHLAL